jgi:hypothetical protein
MTKEWIAITAKNQIIVTSAKDKATAFAQAQKEIGAGDSIIDFGRL